MFPPGLSERESRSRDAGAARSDQPAPASPSTIVSRIRVLRIYHSAVVDEYRQREALLRSEHGYEVQLVCPPAWSEGGSVVTASRETAFPVHVIDVRGRQHPILFWYAQQVLRRVLREFQPHIVDLQEEPYSLAVTMALRAIRMEVPTARVCVYTAQNIRKRYPPPFAQLERRAMASVDAAYPCSTEAGEVLRAKGFTGALHVLPLGVSLGPEPVPRHTGLPLTVGFVGRLEPYKGGELAVRAFGLAAAGIDARLEFVGAGSDEAHLRALAADLGLGDRVDFAGPVPQDEALARIRDFDVLLIPSLTTSSWKEQFGRVAVQAMAAGTPVLASRSGSLAEVVGDAGVLAREGDVGDFSSELGRLLRDPAHRQAVAVRGRHRAENQFGWERVVDGVHRMYEEILATGAPTAALSTPNESEKPGMTNVDR